MTRLQHLRRLAAPFCVAGLMTTAGFANMATAQEAATLDVDTGVDAAAAKQAQESDEQTAEEQSPAPQTPQTFEGDANDAKQSPQPAAGRQPATLGVRIGASATTGVYVLDVMPQGPAARAGIQPRDYILSINDQKLSSPQDFDRIMRDVQPGDEIEMVVWRNQEKRDLALTIPKRQQLARRPNFDALDRSPSTTPPDNALADEAWLGVMLAPAREEDRSADDEADTQSTAKGVRITGVYPSGPAARAGIRRGDVVTKVGDQDVTAPEQFAQLISQHQPDETIELTLMRGDAPSTLSARLGNRADFAAYRMSAPQTGQPMTAGDYGPDEVTEHAVLLEQHRRFAEQHQRIEQRLDELINEVRSLREELKQQE